MDTSTGVFPKIVRIEVTAEDIANGERGSTARCPVARAVERALAPFCVSALIIEVLSGVVTVTTITDGVLSWWPVYYNTDEYITTFIEDFDAERSVQPSTFILTRDW